MNITNSRIFLLGTMAFLLFFLKNELKAQDKRTLSIITSDQDKEKIYKFINKNSTTDSVGSLKITNELINHLHSSGFLTAGVDSIHYLKDDIKMFLWVGPQYKWARLDPGNVDDRILAFSGYKRDHFSLKNFHYLEVSSLLNKIIKYSENNGYPFASVNLDSIDISGNSISAKLNYLPGPFISYDTLQIHGKTKIKKRYLSQYLRIVQGQPFEENNFQNISAKIKRLPFVRLTEEPYLTFQNNESTIHLVLEDKKVNQIDGIVGFFPNSGNDNKLLITGQFNLLLQNMFGSGKALEVEWQKIKPLSQLLDMSYLHPNLFSSPVNAGVSFRLLKEDTTFINRDASINFSVNKGLYSDVRLYTKIRSSSLLSTTKFKNNDVLPDHADFLLHSYGIAYQWKNINDYFFPTKGFIFEVDGSVGNKKIKKNAKLPQEIYAGISDRSLQLNATTGFSSFIPIRKRLVLHNKLSGGILNNNQLFLNDLFRIGGLQSLRGFNENQFFASQYITATGEVRFMLDNQSFFLLFADQGILKYNLTNKNYSDNITGLGLGFNLALEEGIFNFVYAIGATKEDTFNFQASKIHFGYISRF